MEPRPLHCHWHFETNMCHLHNILIRFEKKKPSEKLIFIRNANLIMRNTIFSLLFFDRLSFSFQFPTCQNVRCMYGVRYAMFVYYQLLSGVSFLIAVEICLFVSFFLLSIWWLLCCFFFSSKSLFTRIINNLNKITIRCSLFVVIHIARFSFCVYKKGKKNKIFSREPFNTQHAQQ